MVTLGKDYYDFHFDSTDDLRKIWAARTVSLEPGLLRFSQWAKDFKYLAQKQTHVSLWIRLVEVPQEYWRERILKEIASAISTAIDIDGPTRNRTFGHYARILVDIDLSKLRSNMSGDRCFVITDLYWAQCLRLSLVRSATTKGQV